MLDWKYVGAFGTLAEACRAVGVESAEGRRYARAEGDHGRKAGRALERRDGRGVDVYNWKTGEKASYLRDCGRHYSRQERQSLKRREAVRLAKDHAREAEEKAFCLEVSEEILRVSGPAGNEHPYLMRKRLKAVPGLYQAPMDIINSILADRGVRNDQGRIFQIHKKGTGLVVPLYRDGALAAVQIIASDGGKYFLPNSHVGGCYWMTRPASGLMDASAFAIAEGVATALSVDQINGLPCVVCLSCHGFYPVARYWLKQKPGAMMLICSDEGRGEDEAQKAASAFGGRFVKPSPTDKDVARFRQLTGGDKITDFNDLYIAREML